MGCSNLVFDSPPLLSWSMAQVGAGKRVFQLMDRVPQLPPSGSQKPTGSPAGAALDFQAVSFAYPSRPTSWVLKDFSLQVMGTKDCLVGLRHCQAAP